MVFCIFQQIFSNVTHLYDAWLSILEKTMNWEYRFTISLADSRCLCLSISVGTMRVFFHKVFCIVQMDAAPLKPFSNTLHLNFSFENKTIALFILRNDEGAHGQELSTRYFRSSECTSLPELRFRIN